jgi:hypothetical protein
MAQVDKEKKNLLVFGYGLVLIGVVFSVGRFKDGLTWSWVLLVVASLVLLLSTALQWQALRPAYKGWMIAAHTIGSVVTTVVLTLVFFIIFTPVGIVLRIMRKDHLKRSFDRSAKSYWITRPVVSFSRERYHQQF